MAKDGEMWYDTVREFCPWCRHCCGVSSRHSRGLFGDSMLQSSVGMRVQGYRQKSSQEDFTPEDAENHHVTSGTGETWARQGA